MLGFVSHHLVWITWARLPIPKRGQNRTTRLLYSYLVVRKLPSYMGGYFELNIVLHSKISPPFIDINIYTLL